jgi:CHAD domain-containing protein
MSFAFERDDGTVEQGLQRIATEQIDKALMEASAPEAEFDPTVHQLRRRCKNLRGLLRIVRPELKAFKDEDSAISSIASQLSHARDAAVMLETFAGLAKEAPDAEGTAPLRDILTERSRSLTLQIDEKTLIRERFGAIADGIEDTYRRMRRRMVEAEADGLPATMHAWRKQAKYHRHHIMLLRRHAPEVLDSRTKLLADLAEFLGQHHDLAVLVEVLTARVAGQSAALDTISEMAERRQDKLAAQAFALGRQIGAEKPGAMTERLRRYWTLEGIGWPRRSSENSWCAPMPGARQPPAASVSCRAI